MLWNKPRRSKNVNDQRKDKDVRSPTGKILAAGLVASLLAGTYWAQVEERYGPELTVAMKETRKAALENLVKDDPHLMFVEAVLGSSEIVWTELFAQEGQKYQPPTLVLYNEKTVSACGPQRVDETGPFYCPEDKQIYIDLQSLEKIAAQDSTVSDFAQAYVIAHEVGHHIQNINGVLKRMEDAQDRGEPLVGDGQLSVRLELQADCLAGVWARHAQERFKWLEPGDIEEALMAASRAGDDYLMRKANQQITPETFTHGTSEQRIKWFNIGFNDPQGGCRTLDGAQL